MNKKVLRVYLAKEGVPYNEAYGLLRRADYQPMLTPVQQIQEPEMTM